MALIGEIITKIKVDKTDLKKNLKASEKALMKFQKTSKKILSGLKVGVAALATGFVGLAVAINKSREDIDSIGKTADKLGIATERLQELRFAAQQSGVETRTLDMALQRMVRRVSEAAKGTGEAKDALKELGLDAQQLAGLSPDKQFAKIAEAMKNVKNQTDKVRLAFKLFDSEGVALVNTLNSDLKKTQEEFQALGLALSTREVKNVEKFNDAINKVQNVFGILFQKITAGLAGPLTDLTNKFLEFLKAGGADAIKSSIVAGVESMIEAFTRLRDAIKFLRMEFSDFIGKFKSGLSFLRQELSDLIEKLVGATTDLFEMAGKGLPSFGSSVTAQQVLSDMQRPAATPKAGKQQPVMKLEITTDSDSLIKKMLKDRAAQDLVKTVLEKETAQVGK